MSGLSGDCRDLEEAAANGHERAQLALGVFHSAIRHYLGGYMTVLGGVDAIVFTGGIGENSVSLREKVCSNLEWAGIRLDPERNQNASEESQIQADDSNVQIWVVPTNEEIVVARQTVETIEGRA